MTGYQSKKAMARDKLAHMTFEQRCRLSEQCLPEAPYRAMLTKLHDEMLAALAQPEQEPVAWKHPDKNMVFWKDTKEVDEYHGFKPTIPLYTTTPQRTWVGLTDPEVELYWDWEDFQIGAGRSTILEMVRDIEAKLKEKNNG